MAGQTLGLFGLAWDRGGDEFRPSDASVPVQPGSRLTLRDESGLSARLDVQLAVDWGAASVGGRSSSCRRPWQSPARATPGGSWRRRPRSCGGLGSAGATCHRTASASSSARSSTRRPSPNCRWSKVTSPWQPVTTSARRPSGSKTSGTDRHEMPVKVRTDRIVARVDLPHASVSFAPWELRRNGALSVRDAGVRRRGRHPPGVRGAVVERGVGGGPRLDARVGRARVSARSRRGGPRPAAAQR